MGENGLISLYKVLRNFQEAEDNRGESSRYQLAYRLLSALLWDFSDIDVFITSIRQFLGIRKTRE